MVDIYNFGLYVHPFQCEFCIFYLIEFRNSFSNLFQSNVKLYKWKSCDLVWSGVMILIDNGTIADTNYVNLQ